MENQHEYNDNNNPENWVNGIIDEANVSEDKTLGRFLLTQKAPNRYILHGVVWHSNQFGCGSWVEGWETTEQILMEHHEMLNIGFENIYLR